MKSFKAEAGGWGISWQTPPRIKTRVTTGDDAIQKVMIFFPSVVAPTRSNNEAPPTDGVEWNNESRRNWKK